MDNVWKTLGGLLLAIVILFAGLFFYEKQVLAPTEKPGEMEPLPLNAQLLTVNTTRVGSDDALETAVAVSQLIYPVTEEENSPGAVILINRAHLAEAMVAANRVQHFPVNAPLLWVDENVIPSITRDELLRLAPEGVPMDGNVQVYLVGTIGEAVEEEVREMGYRIRRIQGSDPIDLAEQADMWTSTQHGDHKNAVAIANLDNLEPAIPAMFWNAHRGDGFAFVTNEGIPDATIRMLQRRANGPWIYVFGDSSVISDEIVKELGRYGLVERVLGSTPTEVSATFASFHDQGRDWGAWFWQESREFGWGIDDAGHNAIFVNLDGPGGWQNAVSATTLSHMGKHAPVLILEGAGEVPPKVIDHLRSTKPYPTSPGRQLLNHGLIIGGEETISWETQAALDLYLDAYIELEEASAGQPEMAAESGGSQ